MGKKKSQNHVQQSMGNMVSRAALAQLGPQIGEMIQAGIRQLGSQLATQQASTLETLFSRIRVLEEIAVTKLGYTKEALAEMVADIEDTAENLTKAETIENGDVVRLEVSTRAKDQTEFQGSSRLKISKTGSGETIGAELETALVGMKAGETKELEFGADKQMVAKFVINRVSRPIKVEVSNADQSQG